MSARYFLAFDLGAESGRTMLGLFDEGRIQIKELNRFQNKMIDITGHLHWDVLELFEEIKRGMRLCATEVTPEIESIAIDTWGVDFALLGRDGSILGFPYTYRDNRTNNAMEGFLKRISREHIYQLTGIQLIQINSLFQLYSMVRDKSPLLKVARDLLFMPDLFNYLLTGIHKTEFTIATTSQLYNPRKRDWDDELFRALGLSRKIMEEIISPGTTVGNISGAIRQEAGLGEVPVIATASHDTASAVAAVPAEGRDWAYISSGTWSLVGVESEEPILTEKAMRFNFTNEGGVEGTFRFLKNVMGLWLVQQCKKAWARNQDYTYEELTQLAAAAPPFKAFIDPDCQEFLNPKDMPAAVGQFCKKTKQILLKTPGDIIRCILESLALKYRFVLDELREVYPHSINKIHIIGGGTQNHLLCQWTADATGLPVIAGPIEAAAIGNIMIQALGLGYLTSLREVRDTIRDSFELARYEPRKRKDWDTAYERFQGIVLKGDSA